MAGIAIVHAGYEARVATLRQFNDVCRLGAGQSRRSQAVNRSLCNLAGSGEIVVREQSLESLKNCPGSVAVQLLVNDGVRERLKRREAARAQVDDPNLFDQCRHHRVGTQMGDGVFAHRRSF